MALAYLSYALAETYLHVSGVVAVVVAAVVVVAAAVVVVAVGSSEVSVSVVAIVVTVVVVVVVVVVVMVVSVWRWRIINISQLAACSHVLSTLNMRCRDLIRYVQRKAEDMNGREDSFSLSSPVSS